MSKQQTKTHKLASAPQQVKILAGQWRGTKLSVLLQDDVRPTPARVRETLFNWLQATIVGSDCLDLFAGSAALGFEALSRGANSVVAVDNDPQVIRLITQQVDKLQAKSMQVVCTDAKNFIHQTQQTFDVIFLDPPFSKIDAVAMLPIIHQQQLVTANSLVYLEFSTRNRPSTLPEPWQWQRQSKAGEVEYGLVTIK